MKKLKSTLIIMISVAMIVNTGITALASGNNDYMYRNHNKSLLVVEEDGLFIDGRYYTRNQFEALLCNAREISTGDSVVNSEIHLNSAAALVAGTWFVPGVGEVIITATGVILISGVAVEVGSWVYDAVTDWFAKQAEIKEAKANIPSRLKDGDGNVKVGDFNQPVSGKTAYKEKGGWTIEKDTAGHGGRKWKLKNKKGDRIASLDENGKVLGK
ncbi:hypothetical protein [Butyrivibrio sp. NC3005]|uniref:hypothetical protein n=1 Tax=Butyrivibrio sp. NC3005 TaxID=1280685 RepID=UPI0004219990|nr:hypothetical protein [Butyrivibrio sp. NC3005]